MSIEPRIVVTGRTADGSSIFIKDEPTEAVTMAALPGTEFHLLWGTGNGVAEVGTGTADPTFQPFFPGPGGTRFLFIRFAPGSGGGEGREPGPTPDEIFAEANAKLPGLVEMIEPESEGMHTTDSVDYGICLEGELCLELDDGREVRLTPGSTIVQRGTRHAWKNRSDKPALMCYVLVGAERTS